MKHGKGREAGNYNSDSAPKAGADLHGNCTSEDGGLSTSKHVAEAEKYLEGAGLEGVNVETGWSKSTKFTGKFNRA